MKRKLVLHKLPLWLALALLLVSPVTSIAQSTGTAAKVFLPLVTNSMTNTTKPPQQPQLIRVEGVVEQVVSEHPVDQPIISRATIKVERVIEGGFLGKRLVIRYLGGTVGAEKLYVSHEPILIAGMELGVKLYAIGDGEYSIRNVDRDLTVKNAEVFAAFLLHPGKWSEANMPVRLSINPNTSDVAGTLERDTIINAMRTWNQADCSYFVYGDGLQNNSCTANTNTPDGVNCVEWQPGPKPGGETDVLATTYVWPNENNAHTEVDLVFWELQLNADGTTSNTNWSVNPSSNDFDVETIALHELGHALGLYHETVNPAIMKPIFSPGTTIRALFQDDIDGICAQYPLAKQQLSIAYVDATAASDGNCAQTNKCKTITHGFKRASNQGQVRIQPGTYHELLTLNRPMTLIGDGGTVTIDP